MPHQNLAYDDEELSISLAPSNSRRTQSRPPEVSQYPQKFEEEEKTTEPAPQKAEQRIGAYHVIRTLGEGSFGKVKLAVHKVTNQQVALKIIARKKLISRDMAGRVEREIEYLQLLRHPHIIKLYTVIKTQTEIIMVLEYAGGELFDYIVQHGKMQEDKARRFFQQIICAVEYCHRHKIVHRDLKPENLLLDTDLNVKIADFGLSNIMTDGNFLKTSCGSPNYAAPEVINGKLYAGPEVDVWSCGVILYVLLVGRLPFDDDHIPSLFAKIAKGNYNVPSYMSHGASSLIRKMLAVNPVHRVTIEEIRQDPWFLKDLPAYLKPPVEEFLDTGVDPSKAINFRTVAPNAPVEVQVKLHNDLVSKVGKTMGYGSKDVQEALEADEPSAIKDAYLIVREYKLMQQKNPNLPQFGASSPPPWNDLDGSSLRGLEHRPATPGSPLGIGDGRHPQNLPENNRSLAGERAGSSSASRTSQMAPASASTDRSIRPYISKIGILPSSLPAYHRDYMEARKQGKNPRNVVASNEEPERYDSPQSLSSAEKAETVRRLKPHSRSQLKFDESKKPAGMTPVPTKKNKPTRWQFGIRSRNQPLEALGCIYRALEKLGAEWVIDEEWKPNERNSDKNRDSNRSFDSNDSDDDGGFVHRADSTESKDDSSNSIRFSARDPTVRYKLPADPWVIRVRWRKGGMYPPGTVPPGSTHSSQVDLQRQSVTSLSSTGGSVSPQEAHITTGVSGPTDGVSMHLDIQLYEMEHGVYLVDFKCAGYEVGGQLLEEKAVTSPFPFLDLTSKLIIQLAEAD